MNLENLAYVVLFADSPSWPGASSALRTASMRSAVSSPLSAPSTTYPYPLLSFPRFALVIFPAFIALAAVARQPWLVVGIAGTGTLLLGVNLLRWAAWQFIG